MPINPNLKLANNILDLKTIEQAPTRKGYGEGLLEAGEKNEKVVALCADLTGSTMMDLFAKKFPERFIEMGVAEQNLAAIASGLANYGKIPFISSYAMFSPGRNWEQIRTTICYNNVPVKIAGSHAGVSVGPDGATHQAIEDIAITRVIPNMTVIAPCDTHEAKKATLAAAEFDGPVYLRFTREKTPIVTTAETPFKIGRAEILWESENPQVAIIGCGPLVYEALLAAEQLTRMILVNTMVINCHTIKPIDEEMIISAARKCGAIVSVEEHQVNGGLGSAIAEVLTRNYPVPMEYIGMPNSFGESGEPDELLEKYKMKSKDIVEAVKKVIQRKIN